jgi:hypothetical protein
MADDKLTNDEALAELASLGRRIAELASVFEAGRGADSMAKPADEATPPDAAWGEARPPAGVAEHTAASGEGRSPVRDGPPRRQPGRAVRAVSAPRPTSGSAPAPGGVVASTPRPGTDRRPRLGGTPWPWRPWPATPMVVSIAVHVVALLLLALVFVPVDRSPERLSIVSLPAEDQPPEEMAEVAFEPIVAEPPLDAETVPQPADNDLAEIDPVGAAGEQAAEPADQPPLGLDDHVGGGFDAGDMLAAVGGGGGGEATGGDGAGGGRGGGGTFFGRKSVGRRVLFMCDNSASYVDGGFQAVLLELSRAVALMKPEQSFHVVFFSDAAYPLLHPESVDAFLPATPENKRRLDAWLPTVELCLGGRGIRGAAKLATSLEPDVVYFLSDGDHADSVVERLVALPLDGTVMHTFGMQADVRDRRTGLPDPDRIREQQRRNQTLLRIAEAHGGTFTPVTISPQAAMAAAVRPVKKNRIRGRVWGTALPATEP